MYTPIEQSNSKNMSQRSSKAYYKMCFTTTVLVSIHRTLPYSQSFSASNKNKAIK